MANEVVLVVDDDLTTIRLCQGLLERASYLVVTAINPLDGLNLIRERHIDLLLSDIVMPDMDGFELIGQAKQIQPDLPVVIMTGHGSVENAILALNRGADGLIIKPFKPFSELTKLVKKVIEESRQKRDALRLQALRPLFDVSERLLAETSPQILEKLILQTIREILGSPAAGIYRIGPENKCLTTVQIAMDDGDDLDPKQLERLILSLSCDGAPVLINHDKHKSFANQFLKENHLMSLIVAPVQRKNQFVFCALRRTGQAGFTEADLEMFTILARQAAVALENANLYSELREYIQRVEDSQQALIQMEKMAAVGRLVASMAHEINNPLQAVKNCLHLAARSNVNNDQRFRYLKMMDIELDRLVNTVKQMLDFYRPGGDNREDIDICLIVNQVLDLLKPQFREQNIKILVTGNGNAETVNVVPGQIQQVIFNLLINAIEAIQEDACGRPALVNKTGDIWVDIRFENSTIIVRIEDSGPGIPIQQREQVFEPFVSTKPSGTGLGLSVSYGIIERHQGSLALTAPSYGQGACFEIRLPSTREKLHGKNINC